MITPALNLDDLATAWLPRRVTQLAAMPGLNNDLGSIQMEADIAAIKHPIFPPYSAGNEITWLTILNGRQLAQQVSHVDIRWRAFEVQRRCEADGWKLESRTSLLPEQPGVQVEVTITNTRSQARGLSLGFLCSGRALNTGNDGYFGWGVPSIPTTVSTFSRTVGLKQTVTDAGIPGARCLTNETGNAHSVHAFSPAPARWERERVPVWEKTLAAGESFTVILFASFHADRETACAIARQWRGMDVFSQARLRWEKIWSAAFTPGNSVFSGHLPLLESPNRAMLKIYYNAILTILTCRRVYPHALIKPEYLTLWPRLGEGASWLAWEINAISGILARLDPKALHAHWLTMASAPWMEYQMTNFFTGEHGGWACSAHPQSLFTGGLNLIRWAGDKTWMEQRIVRTPRKTEGFGGAPEGYVERKRAAVELSGLDAFLQAVHAHREHHLPGKPTVDYGAREAYLECVTTYAHGTAGHTALQAWALGQAAPISGMENAGEIKSLENAVMDLYSPGLGHFQCEYPDGTRHPAANLYDIGLVLRHMGNRLPRQMVEEIADFVRRDLLTPTWAHCMAPTDLDSLSGLRCDHQWAGCFPVWPAQFVVGLLQSGERGDWIAGWLEGLSKVTEQGPFAQAYWAEDVHPPEAGAAAKCYDDLPHGMHWVVGDGLYFAEMILDGICGLQADLTGRLTLKPGLDAWSQDACLTNIAVHGKAYELRKGKLTQTR